MTDRSKDAMVATLEHGATLVVFPDRDAHIYTEGDAAVRALSCGGWDYFLTRQNTDTGDELEQWIPLHDPRWELDRELEYG